MPTPSSPGLETRYSAAQQNIVRKLGHRWRRLIGVGRQLIADAPRLSSINVGLAEDRIQDFEAKEREKAPQMNEGPSRIAELRQIRRTRRQRFARPTHGPLLSPPPHAAVPSSSSCSDYILAFGKHRMLVFSASILPMIPEPMYGSPNRSPPPPTSRLSSSSWSTLPPSSSGGESRPGESSLSAACHGHLTEAAWTSPSPSSSTPSSTSEVWVCIHQLEADPECPAHVYILDSLPTRSLASTARPSATALTAEDGDPSAAEPPPPRRPTSRGGSSGAGRELEELLDSLALIMPPTKSITGHTFQRCSHRSGPWSCFRCGMRRKVIFVQLLALPRFRPNRII